jgi:hypothetical protein
MTAAVLLLVGGALTLLLRPAATTPRLTPDLGRVAEMK